MNSENKAAIDKIIKESDNMFEALIGILIYYMVHIIFRAVEVVVEFGTNTQSTH